LLEQNEIWISISQRESFVKLKAIVVFSVDYFGNKEGKVTPKDSPPSLSQRAEEED
jgi:hypothetical protein